MTRDQNYDLFASPPSPRKLARQLAEEGMERAARHADDVDPGWIDRAHAALDSFLTLSALTEFTNEDVREFADLPEPPDRRAWGAVMVCAVRAGKVVKHGYRPHRDPSRHGGVSTVWRRKYPSGA